MSGKINGHVTSNDLCSNTADTLSITGANARICRRDRPPPFHTYPVFFPPSRWTKYCMISVSLAPAVFHHDGHFAFLWLVFCSLSTAAFRQFFVQKRILWHLRITDNSHAVHRKITRCLFKHCEVYWSTGGLGMVALLVACRLTIGRLWVWCLLTIALLT